MKFFRCLSLKSNFFLLSEREPENPLNFTSHELLKKKNARALRRLSRLNDLNFLLFTRPFSQRRRLSRSVPHVVSCVRLFIQQKKKATTEQEIFPPTQMKNFFFEKNVEADVGNWLRMRERAFLSHPSTQRGLKISHFLHRVFLTNTLKPAFFTSRSSDE